MVELLPGGMDERKIKHFYKSGSDAEPILLLKARYMHRLSIKYCLDCHDQPAMFQRRD